MNDVTAVFLILFLITVAANTACFLSILQLKNQLADYVKNYYKKFNELNKASIYVRKMLPFAVRFSMINLKILTSHAIPNEAEKAMDDYAQVRRN